MAALPAAVAAVAAVAVVAAALLCVKRRRRSAEPRMLEQIKSPVDARGGSKRPRFKYTTYEEFRSASTRKSRKSSIVINGNFPPAETDAGEYGFDGNGNGGIPDVGYIDIVSTASPGSAALAFARFEEETAAAGDGGHQFRLPSFSDTNAMAPTSRKNPLFDAATLAAVFDTGEAESESVWDDMSDNESDAGGSVFDLDAKLPEGQAEAGGFGFGRRLSEADIHAGVKDDADLTGYGFDVGDNTSTPAAAAPSQPAKRKPPVGGVQVFPTLGVHSGFENAAEADMASEPAIDPDVLARLQKEMDDALEALNTPTEVDERIDAIKRIGKLLTEDAACVQECVDMNGVLSIISAVKEDVNEDLQLEGIKALNTLCEHDQALAEVLQGHAMNFWAHALEVEVFWRDALIGLVKAARSEPAVHLMISENVLSRLCDRLAFADPDEQAQMMVIFSAIAGTAERLAKLDGMFEALSVACADAATRKALLDPTLQIIEAATGSFGVDAITAINSSGLANELRNVPSSVMASHTLLRKVLTYLEE
mmetsp:Transcript_19765/g.58972  ORF Transcript_19765/g.58972 Transcript_19765/m.58972 type:complete len:537 (+) Transcript_19765:273-1883(+)